MMMKKIFYLLTVVLIVLQGCNKDSGPVVGPPTTPDEIGRASVWLTTGDKTKLLSKESDVSITAPITATVPVITIDPAQTYQQIDGFGAAVTGSSAYLIKNLSTTKRNALVQELFDPNSGIGISYVRLTIGASDFSLEDYTYNDMPAGQTDFNLQNFSLSKDADVINVMKQIVSVNPDIHVMGSPWSAPAWMKTNGSLKYVNGQTNKLKTDCYGVYADYFVKYIQAYAAEGITIEAVTPQNEPLHSTAAYPCMQMEASEQINFIKNHLGPALQAASLPTKIIAYDHNWDNTNYAISVLNDAGAKQYIAGSAFHAYAGNVSAMSIVRNAHPDKGLYFTEVSGGEWATNFSDNLQWNMSNIFIGTTKNWSKNVLLWNLALDQNFGPKNNGCSDCRGVITITTDGTITRNVEYYTIGHFSKFVQTGAYRIASTITENVANVDFVSFV
ncbi:MAG: glucan endo-1,6-beta-glucosidase, partial [Cytophagia bacterium]|nr:glucan endo-1,6-beta-glucosidase [Cytophagia bacterium]